jgi:hypothetical protein
MLPQLTLSGNLSWSPMLAAGWMQSALSLVLM